MTSPVGIRFFGLQNNRYFLFESNGTAGGTVALVEVPGEPSLVSDSLTGKIFFSINLPSTGTELWVTDGTVSGTFMIRDLLPGPESGYRASPIGLVPPVAWQGELYFIGATGPFTLELFKTDGTDAGTVQLSSLPTGRGPTDLTVGDAGVFFAAQIAAGSDARTWYHTDGTPTGTMVVGPTQAGTNIPAPASERLFALGKLFYAGARVGTNHRSIWTLSLNGYQQIFPPTGTPNDAANDYDVNPANFALLNGQILLAGTHTPPTNGTGRELWKTDGTPSGTSLVRDIATVTRSNVSWLSEGPDGDLYFPASTPATGVELFKTSGTVGSTEVVADLMPGPQGSNPSNLTFQAGRLVFNATVPGVSRAACVSDGSAIGTRSVGATSPGPGTLNTLWRFKEFAGKLYFSASRESTGLELWVSDGTSSGTTMLPEFLPGPAGGFAGENMTEYNGGLFIPAATGLYRIDAVTGGRTQLLNYSQGACSAGIVSPIGMFFAANDNRLWITGGTGATTLSVVGGGNPPWLVRPIAWIDGSLYFFAKDATQRHQIWRSSGTEASTLPVTNMSNTTQVDSPFGVAHELNGKIYFFRTTTNEFLVFDPGTGTLAPMTSPGPAGSVIRDLHGLFAGGLLVSVSVQSGARNMYIFNGDPLQAVQITSESAGFTFHSVVVAGPYVYYLRKDGSMLRSIHRATSAPLSSVQLGATATWLSQVGVRALYPVGNDVYFEATQPGFGSEPFRTSAPATTVSMVRDIVTGINSSTPSDFIAFNSRVYFSAYTPSTGTQLWSTDGTAAGTQAVTSVIDAYPAFEFAYCGSGAGLLFFKRPGGTGQLIRSDGTPSGTWNIGDINPSPGIDAAELNSKLVLAIRAGVEGTWTATTDGTSAGTELLVNTAATTEWAPRDYKKVGSKVFYVASKTVGSNTIGDELAVTDGTPGGTFIVKDIIPGSGSSYPRQITDLNGTAIFVAYGTNGDTIYRSDGTSGGTYPLKTIRPGADSDPRELVAAGPFVFFTADDGIHGRELWRTDGTVAGTILVRDIIPGVLSSSPSQLRAADGRLYFTAATPDTGLELWTSDGTASGTIMLFQTVDGPGSAAIEKLTTAGNRLYFLATVPPVGTSLWSFDRAGGLSLLCISDYNRDGSVAIDDVFEFLNDWFVAQSRADIDADSTIGIQDVFEFLNIWFAGCS